MGAQLSKTIWIILNLIALLLQGSHRLAKVLTLICVYQWTSFSVVEAFFNWSLLLISFYMEELLPGFKNSLSGVVKQICGFQNLMTHFPLYNAVKSNFLNN